MLDYHGLKENHPEVVILAALLVFLTVLGSYNSALENDHPPAIQRQTEIYLTSPYNPALEKTRQLRKQEYIKSPSSIFHFFYIIINIMLLSKLQKSLLCIH